jgi:hypothetical protein
MDPKDSPKTAFSTRNGHYEFIWMPFSFKTAPSCFQRMMNNVLIELNNTQCFVYLDDIVLHGSTLDDHNWKLRSVLARLRKHDLKLQPDKCEFLKKSCEYLGYVISDKGIESNSKKVASVQEVPIPRNIKKIKIFLGMVGYYRKFIENFFTVVKHLTHLLKKNVNFE